MEVKIKVDVILPVYNQAKFLEKSLDSIFSQTLSDFRVIVVNDGSTEDVRSIIDKYRVDYIDHGENKGLPTALNTGLKHVTGEYVTWTSADNIAERDWLETLVKALDKHREASGAYSDYCQIDENGRFIRNMSKGEYTLNGKVNFGPSFMYRKEAVDRVGEFDTTLFRLEDRDYSIRMAEDGPLVWVRRNLYRYRIHKESMSGTPPWKRPRKRFNEKYENILKNPKEAKVITDELNVSVLIPFSSGDTMRKRAFEYVLGYYKKHFPDIEICVGKCPEPFSVAKAFNNAYRKSTGEILLLTGADVVTPIKVVKGIIKAMQTAEYVRLNGDCLNISQPWTVKLLSGETSLSEVEFEKRRGIATPRGVKRDNFRVVGGYDERFVGWGAEDTAFNYTLRAYFGNPECVAGDIYHLWHPLHPTKVDKKARKASINYKLRRRYKTCETVEDVERLRGSGWL